VTKIKVNNNVFEKRGIRIKGQGRATFRDSNLGGGNQRLSRVRQSADWNKGGGHKRWYMNKMKKTTGSGIAVAW
jgi:hypothetical protein